jgi:hypothetical protein
VSMAQTSSQCKLWVNKGKRGALPLSHDFETYGSGIAYFIKVVFFYPTLTLPLEAVKYMLH